MANSNPYPARLDIEYPNQLNRLTTFFRILWAIPIVIILSLLIASDSVTFVGESGGEMTRNGGGIVGGLFAATALMILFRQRYPRWWFDFMQELNRFSTRVSAYILLLTDKYPSTVDKQAVTLDFDYPDVKRDLNRWLPLVKWLLAAPHYVILLLLAVALLATTVVSWFAILFTGRYPKGLFNFAVGVNRWNLRVRAYTILLITDTYPPFSLKP